MQNKTQARAGHICRAWQGKSDTNELDVRGRSTATVLYAC